MAHASTRTRRLGIPELVTTLGAALVYAFAVAVGRATVLPESNFGLIWPAAAVSVLWMVARIGRRGVVVDIALMAAITCAIVVATGGTWLGSLFGSVAAVVQAVVPAALLRRRRPGLRSHSGARVLDRGELWWFFFAALAGAVLSVPLIEAESLLAGPGWRWDVCLLWLARNLGSIVVLVPLVFATAEHLQRRRTTDRRALLDQLGARVRSRPVEWIALLVATPLVHLAWFLSPGQLTIVFPLLTLACWGGSRLPAELVALQGCLVAALTIGLTAHGAGPFLEAGNATTQIAAAQLYGVLFCAVGLALALERDDRADLASALTRSRDDAEAQAKLLETIVDTMAEGVRVVDRDGEVLLRNAAATRLLLGSEISDEEEPGAGRRADLQGIRNLDGTGLDTEELPFALSLAGTDVRDLALVVRAQPDDERVVAFTTARLPESAGGGVVTMMRDVTVERAELRRAAQVQAGLLPAEVPSLAGYDLAARVVPAGSVGGDFYDWYGLDHGVVLTLADVMGKGAGAAILAATARSLLRAHGRDDEIVRPLVETERSMAGDLENTGAFVTLFHAFVHGPSGTVTYSDAGHGLAAVVGPDGSVRRLRANGLPLGIAPDEPREIETDRLEVGETLVVVSDGVLDALGGSLADLAEAWRAAADARSADEAVAAVVRMAEAGDIDDDLTVLALRRET
ncbi:hypothetical protein GCM10022219_17750 [Microbacterium oryzae]